MGVTELGVVCINCMKRGGRFVQLGDLELVDHMTCFKFSVHNDMSQ